MTYNEKMLLDTLAEAKKVFELTIWSGCNSEKEDSGVDIDDCFHDIFCNTLDVYKMVCLAQDQILGTNATDHEYRIIDPADANHLTKVK